MEPIPLPNITEESNTQDFWRSNGFAFFDYDNDGDLDLYLTHDANQPNILYQNDGTGDSLMFRRHPTPTMPTRGMG